MSLWQNIKVLVFTPQRAINNAELLSLAALKKLAVLNIPIHFYLHIRKQCSCSEYQEKIMETIAFKVEITTWQTIVI